MRFTVETGTQDRNTRLMFVISEFRYELDENCALLGYYTASSDNVLSEITSARYVIIQNNAVFMFNFQ